MYYCYNRTEKRNMKANTVLLCEDADKQLSSFIDTLHLECLEMYKCDSAKQKDDGSEKTDMVELPQVNNSYYICLQYDNQRKLNCFP